MGQDETEQNSANEHESLNEIERLTEKLNQISGELDTIKTNVEKRKSETTTLKILFYTGLAVLLFGFIYTNQTLQRAQHNNLEANITALQSQINHNLLSLQKKLHEEILDTNNQINSKPEYRLHNAIKDMNQALSGLKPETQTMDTLIRTLQKDSQELSNIVRREEKDKIFTPEAVP